jgi:hypothetical protein
MRASFADGSGVDLIVMAPDSISVKTEGRAGKQWSVVETEGSGTTEIITLIAPFESYRLAATRDADSRSVRMGDWRVDRSPAGITVRHEDGRMLRVE